MEETKYVLLEQYFGCSTESVSKYVYLIESNKFKKGALVIGDNYVGRIIKEVKEISPNISYKFTTICSDINKIKKQLERDYLNECESFDMEPGIYYDPNFGYDYIDEEEIADMYEDYEERLAKDVEEYVKEILFKLQKGKGE